jgi:predicted MFS family arabinose efflux permease
VAAPRILTESERRPGHFDVTGALTSTAGMAALVYGFIRASSNGWSDSLTVGAFIAAVVLLAAFFVVETRAKQAIVPLRLFADRNRASSYGARLFLVAGMFGMFYFLTQFLQEVLDFSPIRAGLAFLPMTAAMFASSQATSRLLSRVGAKPLMIVGAVFTVLGMGWLSQISAGTSYGAGILGPMVLFGIGVGPLFVPLTLASLSGVAPADSGAASGLVNVMQQVGGALGLSVLVTVFGTSSRNAAKHPVGATPVERAQHVMASGVGTAFTVSAICMVCVLALVVLAIQTKPVTAMAAGR